MIDSQRDGRQQPDLRAVRQRRARRLPGQQRLGLGRPRGVQLRLPARRRHRLELAALAAAASLGLDAHGPAAEPAHATEQPQRRPAQGRLGAGRAAARLLEQQARHRGQGQVLAQAGVQDAARAEAGAPRGAARQQFVHELHDQGEEAEE